MKKYSFNDFNLKFHSVFSSIDKLPWKNDVDLETIFDIATKHFEEFTKDKTKNKNFVRLIGQSGSGKTSQLLVCAEKYFEKQKLNPLKFAVRYFAKLHPCFEEIVKEHGSGKVREITNGFALRCLVITLLLAIEGDFDILFEVTFLSCEFERLLENLKTQNNYKNLFLLIAVNREISDYFIKKRSNSLGPEGERIVSENSKDYFYTALEQAIKYYSNYYPKERVIIWDAFNLSPIFDGIFGNVLDVYFKAREIISYDFKDEKELCKSKVDYILNI